MSKPVINLRKAIRYIERKDQNGKPVSFSARVFKKDGGVATFTDAICTSSYHGGTMNIYTPISNEVRKIKTIFLIEVDGKEVVL